MTPEDLMKKIIEWLRLRPNIRLVVLDTLANYNPKLISQNKNDLVTQANTMNMFLNIAKGYGVCIVITHHSSAKNPNQSVEASGLFSNSLNNLSNNTIFLTATEGGERTIATRPKRDEHRIVKTQLLQKEIDGEVTLGKTIVDAESETIEEKIFKTVKENGDTFFDDLHKLIKKNRTNTQNICNQMLREGVLQQVSGIRKKTIRVPNTHTSIGTRYSTKTTLTNNDNNTIGEYTIDDNEAETQQERAVDELQSEGL